MKCCEKGYSHPTQLVRSLQKRTQDRAPTHALAEHIHRGQLLARNPRRDLEQFSTLIGTRLGRDEVHDGLRFGAPTFGNQPARRVRQEGRGESDEGRSEGRKGEWKPP